MGYITLDLKTQHISHPNDLVFFKNEYPGKQLHNDNNGDDCFLEEKTISFFMTLTTSEPPQPRERQEEVQEPIHLPIPEPHEYILPDRPLRH